MRVVGNTGNDRVIDLIRPLLNPGFQIDMATSSLSLFAFSEILKEIEGLAQARIVLPPGGTNISLLGTTADRPQRNNLRLRWLANHFIQWVSSKAEIRRALGGIPQGIFAMRDNNANAKKLFLALLDLAPMVLELRPAMPLVLYKLRNLKKKQVV
jgi:hypothetical protein